MSDIFNHHDLHDGEKAQDAAFAAELHAALGKRVEPSVELSARLYAIAAEREAGRTQRSGGIRLLRPRTGGFVFAMPRIPIWLNGAVAALLLAGVFVAGDIHLHRERERAEATREFTVATQIEQQALAHTREQLRQQGIQFEP